MRGGGVLPGAPQRQRELIGGRFVRIGMAFDGISVRRQMIQPFAPFSPAGSTRQKAPRIEKPSKNPILAVTSGKPRNHWWFSRVFHTVKIAKIIK